MTSASSVISPEVRHARTMFAWVGLIVPVVLLGLSAVVIAAWLPELPDPVAIHWGAEGANGFGPKPMIFFGALIGLGVVLLNAAIALCAHRLPQPQPTGERPATDVAAGTPQWSTTARLLGAVNLGVSGLVAVLEVGSAAIQRGLSDASDAADITGWMLVGFVFFVALAVVGWFLQPRLTTAAPMAVHPDGVPQPLRAGERAAWFGTVRIARSGRIVLGCGLLVALVTTALVVARAPGGVLNGSGWVMVGTCVLLLVLVACNLVFRVQVSAAGLRVRSLIGWPSTRIPLTDIADVRVARIDPFAEFGGWGWRIAVDGRRGVVLRKGEALQVTRADGRVFVATADGAGEAAAVLQALIARTDPRAPEQIQPEQAQPEQTQPEEDHRDDAP